MPPERNYLLALETLFKRKHVVLLDDLRNALQTHSRTTIFRVLSSVGYRTSYSHAGRFYTLKDIPKFSDPGIWFWRDVGFSAHGTLRATAVSLVEQAPAGQTHEELQGQLRLRLHDTLLDLVEAKALTRRPWEDIYVYLNADHEAAATQWVKRQTLVRHPIEPKPILPLDPARVIEILGLGDRLLNLETPRNNRADQEASSLMPGIARIGIPGCPQRGVTPRGSYRKMAFIAHSQRGVCLAPLCESFALC